MATEHSLFASKLNPRQLEAVECLHGPLLILAGAGSGKTRVLTYRIAQLIAQGEANPGQILGVTFTNKAAKEMSHRVYSLLDHLEIPLYEPMWISTFHSTCVKILREDIHHLGYNDYFGIYDGGDQLSLIKKCMNILGINDKIHPAKGFLSSIGSAKTFGFSPEEAEKDPGFYMDEQTLEVYRLYEKELKSSNNLDFNDLLIKTNDLFNEFPEVRDKYSEKFQFIMVDEYQDTNRIQYELIQHLTTSHKNICVVGDEDQSIYSWRGADINNILSFEKDYPDGLTVKLEENYRSTKKIVESASFLIKNNSQRKDKTLFTENEEGQKIVVRESANEYEEARYVAQNIENLIQNDLKNYSDFAIFYRTNAQSRVFEEQFRSHSIPYKLIGGIKFYDRMEIKNMLAYMKLAVNQNDDVAFKRVVNAPARGIGKTTVEKLENLSISLGKSLYETIDDAVRTKLVHVGAQKKLLAFKNIMETLKRSIENQDSLNDFYLRILDETQYIAKLKAENTPEATARIDNLDELNNAISHFQQERGEEASVQNFLEEIALVSDVDKLDDENAVTLMTLHISKGLEYPVVHMVGMEQGLFPSGQTIDSGDPDEIEEERRLAYVGITRAREQLFMTFAKTRKVWGADRHFPKSQFIDELPKENLDLQVMAKKRPNFLENYNERFSSEPKRDRSRFNYDDTGASDVMPDYEDFSNEFQEGDDFRKGQKVRHPTFGVGNVFKVEGQGDLQKVSVIFPNKSVRKFVVKYARLEVVF